MRQPEPLYEEGLSVAKEIHARGMLASCLEGLGEVVAAQGQAAWVARLWGQRRHCTKPTVGVPGVLLEGRLDVSAMASLSERYYNALQAPHKELIWFGSGHSTVNDANANQFMDVMVNHVLKQTSH